MKILALQTAIVNTNMYMEDVGIAESVKWERATIPIMLDIINGEKTLITQH